MIYSIAFTMWFLGADGHMTRGDSYKTEAGCQQAADAYNKSDRKWIIQAVCVKSGESS